MHFGKPVLAFDCNFNRNTTEDKAFYFKSSVHLVDLIKTMNPTEANEVGRTMLKIAERRYTWKTVAQQYFALLDTQSTLRTPSNT
jgi:glycosyltransferase involved in cell wall biosynthesis